MPNQIASPRKRPLALRVVLIALPVLLGPCVLVIFFWADRRLEERFIFEDMLERVRSGEIAPGQNTLIMPILPRVTIDRMRLCRKDDRGTIDAYGAIGYCSGQRCLLLYTKNNVIYGAYLVYDDASHTDCWFFCDTALFAEHIEASLAEL